MRILHVINSLDPKVGGPPRVVLDLADAQIAAGAAVGVLTAGLKLEYIPAPILAIRKPEAYDWADESRNLQSFLSRFDLIHCHGVWDRTIFAVAQAARSLAKPYIIAPHGMLDSWSLSQKKWKKKLALALGYRRMLDRAAGLHMLNSDEARLIGPLGLRAKPFVLPNGVHPQTDMALAVDPDFQQFLDESPYILFLSRIHKKKGLDYLVPAFAGILDRHPAFRLLIAGPDDGEQSNIEDVVRRFRLEAKVVFTGPLYGSRKWAGLKQASCFCLTSRQEGFSIAILEALSAGVPALVSEACHFPEVAEAGAGLVVPLDVTGISNALSQLISSPQNRIAMGQAGRKLVADRYTWPAIASRSLEIYSSLLPRSS